MVIVQTVLAAFQIAPPPSFQISSPSLVFMVIQFLVVVVVSVAMMALFGKNKKRGKSKKAGNMVTGAAAFASTNVPAQAQSQAASPVNQGIGGQNMNVHKPQSTWQQAGLSNTGPHSWQGWNTQTPPPATTRPPLPVQPQPTLSQKQPRPTPPVNPTRDTPSQKLPSKWHWSSAGNTNLYPDGGSSSGPSISWGTPPPPPKR